MPRFFEQAPTDIVTLMGETASHISRSLRMRVGEHITLCDNGVDADCVIESVGEEVVVRVLSRKPNESEPTVKTTLYQCVPKGDKLETVIQKAVELGVDRVVPVLSKRCVSRPDEKSAKKKSVRYNKIALESCKQSGRGKVVEVGEMITLDKAFENSKNDDCAMLFYECGGEKLSDKIVPQSGSCSLFIGPEGGFDEMEVEKAKANGIHICTLGPRILRTETAPLAALCCVMIYSNNI